MESIQLTRILWSCKLSTNIALSSRKCFSFRRSRQLDFGPLLKRNFQNTKLTAIRSETSGNEGSISSAVEGEEISDVISSPEKPGLMLGIDRDDSGSVIGLNLIPGIFVTLIFSLFTLFKIEMMLNYTVRMII